jgi:hypothetical protein
MLLDHDFGKFKDGNGKYRTLSLFLEYRGANEPLYTLKKYTLPGNPPSLYQLYLEEADPTEFNFALKYFGGLYEHWEVITNCNWFKPYVAEMRKDLSIKLQADHYQQMKLLAVLATKQGDKIAALKWLALNSGYESGKPTRGRPSALEVEGRLKEELKALNDDKEDLKRLGLQYNE